MTNYKEVFQLAQDKGYELVFISVPKMDIYEPLELVIDERNSFLIELTLIQKWLRDEHKIAVLIGRFATGFYNYCVVPNINKSGEHQIIKRSSFSECWERYESALLQGIHEALKLL